MLTLRTLSLGGAGLRVHPLHAGGRHDYATASARPTANADHAGGGTRPPQAPSAEFEAAAAAARQSKDALLRPSQAVEAPSHSRASRVMEATWQVAIRGT